MKRSTTLPLALAAIAGLAASPARADGFAINRYDPSFAGDVFFSAEHPDYLGMPGAVALTLDYARDPLVVPGGGIGGEVSGMLVVYGQLSLAFLDRFTVDYLAPVSLMQDGSEFADQRPGFGAFDEPVVGDQRLALRGRILGEAVDPFSLHASVRWYVGDLAINDADHNVTDESSRLRLALTGAGTVATMPWSLSLGYHHRPHQEFQAAEIGPDLFAILGAAYPISDTGLEVGVETWNAYGYQEGDFRGEALAEVHYELLDGLKISIGGGPGYGNDTAVDSPALRGLLRVSYARPLTSGGDRDGDGIADLDDACPKQDAWPTPDPERRGCPSPDTDNDGVPDVTDQCVGLPSGNPDKPGCPEGDEDADGVPDAEDVCKTQPVGPFEDPERRGCPSPDRDNDGVLDLNDTCVDEPSGPMEDPDALGCPVRDTDQLGDGAIAEQHECLNVDPTDPSAPPSCKADEDKDGIPDVVDKCPQESRHPYPDTGRRGCPLPDSDKDYVPDVFDACVDTPGSPHPDAKRNGCPGLVAVDGSRLRIHRPIYFNLGSAELQRRSNPVLQAVRDALEATPMLTKVAVEGHTDNVGLPEKNMRLSQARAQSVVEWLVEHGIDRSRLVAKGYGDTAPLVPNTTKEGRDENRRVEFTVLESGPAPAAAPKKRPRKK